jgi:hypothetical protein
MSTDYEELDKEWRSERMLNEFGLTEQVIEKVWRERLATDTKMTHNFTLIERQGLMVVAEMRRDLH